MDDSSVGIFRSLVDNMLESTVIVDWDGNLRFANKAAAKLLGLEDARDLVGRNIAQYLHPDSVADAVRDLGLVKEGKGEFLAEYKLLLPDGATRHIEAQGKKITYQGSSVDLVTFRDISARRQAEEKLRKSEQMFRDMVENANDIIYTLSVDGTFLYVSPNWTEILGHDVSEVVGKPFRPFVHPADLPACQAFLEAVLTTGEKQRGVEYRVKHKDGSWRWHRSNGSLLTTPEGETLYAGIARDMTDSKTFEAQLEQKNAELSSLLEELSASRDMMQAIFDSSPNAFIMTDRDGEIAAGNRYVSEYFGLAIEEVMGGDIIHFTERVKERFVEPERLVTTVKKLSEHPDQAHFGSIEPREILARAARITRPRPRDLATFCVPVTDREGREVGRLWAFVDVTKHKQAEEQVHTIVEVSPVPLIITRVRDGEILFVNEPLAALVGVTSEELIGRRSPDFYFHPEDREFLVKKLGSTGYIKNHEVLLKTLDGSPLWAVLSLATTEIGGEPVVIAGIHDIDARKRMEEELRWERNFVSAVLDTAGALVLVLDSTGRIVRFNKACQETTGYSLAEVKGRPFWTIFLIPEELEEVKSVFQRLTAGQFPNSHENHWLAKNGSKRLIAWSNTALTTDDDQVEYIIATGIDITEQRLAVDALATRLRYEEALAACSQSLLTEHETSDAITKVLGFLQKASKSSRVYVFENFEHETDGLSMRLTHEVCGPGVSPVRDGSALRHIPYARTFDQWRQALSRGEPVQGTAEDCCSAVQGFFELEASPSILALPIRVDEKWHGFIGLDDETEDRQWSDEDIRSLRTAAEMIGIYLNHRWTEEALRVSEERFRGIVENAKDVIYSTKPDGTLTYLSPKLTDATGQQVSDFIGKPISNLVCAEDRERYEKRFLDTVKSGDDRFTTQQFRIEHRNGSWRWFVSDASLIRDEDGTVLETVGIAHDITEMKLILADLEEANKSLKEAQTKLVQSEKMASLGMLVAGIAHEINTPVGAIASSHDTLCRAVRRLQELLTGEVKADPRIEELFALMEKPNQVIQSASRRVTDIVRRLKAFARLDEAELNDGVDIHEGLEDTLTLTHHELKHRVSVIRNYGDIPRISCYPGQLNQVFLNLLINAGQAIGERGEITITTAFENGYVRISFHDNGRGISPDNLKHVFDPGFTTKGVGVGTGLGLSICYQIIMDHRGRITVESEPGEGTTFNVILPTNLGEILENEQTESGKPRGSY